MSDSFESADALARAHERRVAEAAATRQELNEQRETARVCYLPQSTGDGYGWGGGAVLVIGEHAIPFGEGSKCRALAKEIADAWNRTLKEPSND